MELDLKLMNPREAAQEGLALIVSAIEQSLRENQNGLTYGETTKKLELESDQDGKQKNYLAWSILGRMMNDGKVERSNEVRGNRNAIVYRLVMR